MDAAKCKVQQVGAGRRGRGQGAGSKLAVFNTAQVPACNACTAQGASRPAAGPSPLHFVLCGIHPVPNKTLIRPYLLEYMFLEQAYYQKRPWWQAKNYKLSSYTLSSYILSRKKKKN